MGDLTKYQTGSQIHLYSTQFMRNSKAVGVLWGIFSVCYSIIIMVVFTQDEWIGDGDQSKTSGHFGLWRWCVESEHGREACRGHLADFSSILSTPFRVATVFGCLAVVAGIGAVLSLVFFFRCSSSLVFKLCGSLQIISGLCLAVSILSFPSGWGNEEVMAVCGEESGVFSLGNCGLRWAFVLACIALCDAVILGCLAFTLAVKKLKYVPEEPAYGYPSTVYHGEINPGFLGDTQSIYGSRKSINLKPGIVMNQGMEDDMYSTAYSHVTGRSHQSPFRGTYQTNLMM